MNVLLTFWLQKEKFDWASLALDKRTIIVGFGFVFVFVFVVSLYVKEALGKMCRHASQGPGTQASLSVRIQGEMVWGDFPFPLPFLP